MSAPSAPPSGYRAPRREARAELREKKSRFLAVLLPATEEAQARAHLARLQAEHPDATHHCFAWRLGPRRQERAGDDGEPAGTAGLPMLQVLRGADLSDVLAVVVRWYGGTKLGKGGLARAYAEAVRLALEDLPITFQVPTETLALELAYDRVGAVKRLIHPPAVELLAEDYGETVRLRLAVHQQRLAGLRAALADLGVEAPEPEVP